MSEIIKFSMLEMLKECLEKIDCAVNSADDFYLEDGLIWIDTHKTKLTDEQLRGVFEEEFERNALRVRVSKNNTIELGY